MYAAVSKLNFNLLSFYLPVLLYYFKLYSIIDLVTFKYYLYYVYRDSRDVWSITRYVNVSLMIINNRYGKDVELRVRQLIRNRSLRHSLALVYRE